jgi:hypothetical protein
MVARICGPCLKRTLRFFAAGRLRRPYAQNDNVPTPAGLGHFAGERGRNVRSKIPAWFGGAHLRFE